MTQLLILGGHSFIAQLGTDARPTAAQSDAIVAACLDSGICHFDTTYLPERRALGASLARLGRRQEAKIIVWNFFRNFADDEPCGGPRPYQATNLGEMLADLQTDYLDELVVHRVGDAAADPMQEALAARWKADGRVRRLGTWAPGMGSRLQGPGPGYDFVVEPHSLFTSGVAERLEEYTRNGWEIYACSPFVRGRELERLVQFAAGESPSERAAARERIADHLLRYALFAPHVARLIVAMRRPEWVGRNLASVRRGPLSETERSWIETLKLRAEATVLAEP